MENPGSGYADQLLVVEAQHGSVRAMEKLVQRWQRRFWCHACQLTRDPDSAWDVTQQSWLAIIKGLKKIQDPARFRAWAFRIVTNKAIDLLKSRRIDGQVLGTEPAGNEAPHEARHELGELLQRLTPEQRAVLTLYYFEELSIAEVSMILGVPPGTVKSRLYHARGKLKALWQECPAAGGRR
jgi:RNA polymerase sigma-70 factor (ECF subfamily)